MCGNKKGKGVGGRFAAFQFASHSGDESVVGFKEAATNSRWKAPQIFWPHPTVCWQPQQSLCSWDTPGSLNHLHKPKYIH